VILALAAALAVSGCGGGSSATQTASAPSPPPSTAAAPKASTASSQPPRQKKDPSPKPSSSPKGAGKQGPRITLPKGAPEPKPTAQQRAQATVADIALQSPALLGAGANATLPSTYTCDGRDSPPPLRWRGIPPQSAELALFAINVEPVNGKLFFDWALAGIDPGETGIETAAPPKGAVVGRNSFGRDGYSICPPRGKAETYLFALYALPSSLSPHRGFDPATLREEALKASRNAGLMAASYTRG
jgi:hypothetical protein